MLSEVMASYRLKRDFHRVGFFETDPHRRPGNDIRAAILGGRLIAVTGMVGCGKTLFLRRLQSELEREGKVIVSKSLAVDKAKATLPVLMTASFYDLSGEKKIKVPTQGERRERELQDLLRRRNKPVVLFVDEAHDLHAKTPVGLKRLMELAIDGGAMLSIVLAGHPKPRNDLRRPTMEEIGSRFIPLVLDGIAGKQREFLDWLLPQCLEKDAAVTEIIHDEALDCLAARLRTPLQMEEYLTRAFEQGYQVDVRPVTPDVVETVLSRHLDDLEPRLTRHGYDVKSLAEQFRAKPAEIRLLFEGTLEARRTQELTEQMLAAGLPL
jgi:type II secretory pathway predicted ATPase ExeA